MVCNENEDDSMTYEASNLANEAFEILNQFQKTGILCDVEIKCEGALFKCHRLILAATVPYFRSMFTSNMLESNTRRIELKDIHPDALRTVLQFAYTCKATINAETVQSILFAASILQIEYLAEACCAFLKSHITPENCSEIRTFAEVLNRVSLINIADDFMCDNFSAIVKTSGFLNITYHHFKGLLASDDINVRNESEVYDAVVRWIKSKYEDRVMYLLDLIKEVRLPLIDPQYMYDIIEKEEMIRSNIECRDLLDEAKYYRLHQANILNNFVSLGKKIVPRKSAAGVIFCVGGRGSHMDPHKSIECYHLRRNRWFYIPCMNFRRRHVGAISVKGKVYAIGGHDGQLHLSSVECFDVRQNKWQMLSSMNTLRRGLSVGYLGGPLYAIGGLDDNTCYDITERYDIEMDCWSTVANMNTPRGGVAIASMGEFLYACGGNNGTISLNSCERYDPICNRWQQIACLNFPRAGASATVFDSNIYIIGGFDDNSPLNSVEKYDPVTNTWTVVAPLLNCRGGVGSAACGGKIFAIGGHDGFNYMKSVEMYDPSTDSWSYVANLNVPRAGAGVAVCDCYIDDLIENTNRINSSSCV